MDRQFELRMGEIDNVLLQMEQRGHVYFDDMLRIGRVMDLLNKSARAGGIRARGRRRRTGAIERKVSELIDWMVSADLRQWQQVTAISPIAAGSTAPHRRRPGTRDVPFERSRLLESVGPGSAAGRGDYDRQHEAATLAEGARNAVATAAAVGAGALGLGTIVTIAATTAAADVTGILLAARDRDRRTLHRAGEAPQGERADAAEGRRRP